jgi:hypothetical protein
MSLSRLKPCADSRRHFMRPRVPQVCMAQTPLRPHFHHQPSHIILTRSCLLRESIVAWLAHESKRRKGALCRARSACTPHIFDAPPSLPAVPAKVQNQGVRQMSTRARSKVFVSHSGTVCARCFVSAEYSNIYHYLRVLHSRCSPVYVFRV